ncbi:MAG: TonB-dependent receptor [Bacteroidales bacterium]|nr:TonB-dependent receptor [Bacteroidales bacterium]
MKILRNILLVWGVLLTSVFSIYAQNTMIKGFTYDNSNGETLPYCTIQLIGTSYGALSDGKGAFVINKIPAGTYVLKAASLGYTDIIDTIVVKENSTITKRYSLEPASTTLEAVQIHGEGQRKEQETRTSVISVTPKEMSKMPSIGGQPDFAQYLQVLPGIISTGDQGGQLYVRGGTPVQNMLLLDGVILYNPFHSIGIFSVFDMDIMSSADVYTGGFGAEFGGRLSSVMDIKTRDGNKKHISGKVDLSNIESQILLEGPLVKLKDNRKTSLSFILSGKGSYLEQASKIFYPYVGEEGLPYNFLDLYGKLTLATQNGTKLNIFGFNYDDRVNYSSIASYAWNNWGVGANFMIVPGDVPTTIEGSLSYSKYDCTLDDAQYFPKESSMDGFNFNLTFNYYLGKSVLNVGMDVVGYNTDYLYHTALGAPVDINDHTTDLSVFAKFKYNLRNKLLIEPSFRLQYYYSVGEVSPEPRLAVKYNINNKLRLKLAAGLYSQNLISVTSDQDVVSLFSGFMSSPISSELLSDYMINNTDTMKGRLQKSQHVILGLEYDPIPQLSINLEGYYKNFSQLITANRYKMFENDYEFIWERGRAYGGDVTLKYDDKGFYVWFVYSLGWVKRDDGAVRYNPHFDRRHNLNILLSYSFGKRKSWQVDCRWNFGTGFPYTQTLSYYPHYNPVNLNDDYVSNNEDVYFLLADLNQARLPSYHRLDLSAKKKFFLGERNTLELSISFSNIYNYRNIFYVNRTTNNVIYQLPFLYYFGITWRF